MPLEEQQTETPKEKEFMNMVEAASDVKDVQDDVSDVTTYLNQYQQSRQHISLSTVHCKQNMKQN